MQLALLVNIGLGSKWVLTTLLTYFVTELIELHHPLDGVTKYPKYKLLHLIQLTIFLKKEEGTSF